MDILNDTMTVLVDEVTHRKAHLLVSKPLPHSTSAYVLMTKVAPYQRESWPRVPLMPPHTNRGKSNISRPSLESQSV